MRERELILISRFRPTRVKQIAECFIDNSFYKFSLNSSYDDVIGAKFASTLSSNETKCRQPTHGS
jgi:bisphosphoglycerate-independent phosphoglycerate mutase (AlkP superfamily)